MKKNTVDTILWIALVLVLAGLIVVFFVWAASRKQERHFDATVTLSYKDKRPYGAYVAYQEMGKLFQGVPLSVRRSVSYMEDLADSDRGQVMFVLTPRFYPSMDQWNALTRWVRQGNYLVISACRFTQEIKDQLHVQMNTLSEEALSEEFINIDPEDSLHIGLAHPPFGARDTFFYPGRRLDRSIVNLDSSFTEVLGTNDRDYANLIRFRAGNGAVIVQTAPLAFSNYFLLYGNNIRYLEQVWSTLPTHLEKVIWNEYYLYKREDDNRNFWGILGKLLKDPALGSAFLLLLLILAVYVLLGLKRRQRIIPDLPTKSNESLDFVKTIGRLYYSKGDHRNLAIKMGQHFSEYVRSRYLTQLDASEDSSVVRLSSRSGVSEDLVRQISTTLRYVQDAPALTKEELEEWYGLLQTFYKTAQ